MESSEGNNLKKKYGLITAISMVMGIVIGSGIFIKAGKVLSLTTGNMGMAVLTVFIVGVISIICALFFATLGQKYENANGLVDFAEKAVSKRYAYYIGWYNTIIYIPTLITIVSFFTGLFICNLFNYKVFDFETGVFQLDVPLGLGAGIMIIAFGINLLSPNAGGKLQVLFTIIKLIPIIVMGIGGTIAGLVKGDVQNVLDYKNTEEYKTKVDNGEFNLFNAITGFAFALEGYICTTSINSEIENSKRNLPIALVAGMLATLILYALYIFSMSSVGDANEIMKTWPLGETLPGIAFSRLFSSKIIGKIVYVFLTISCLGTANGLAISENRNLYLLSSRGSGSSPEVFSLVDEQADSTIKSGIFGMIISGFWYAWLTIFWMKGPDGFGGVHKSYWVGWEQDELSVTGMYLLYLPIMIGFIVKGKELNVVQRFIVPILSFCCSGFMIFSSFYGKGYVQNVGFFIFVAVVILIGFFFTDDFKNLIKKFKECCKCCKCCNKDDNSDDKKENEIKPDVEVVQAKKEENKDKNVKEEEMNMNKTSART
ncbi:MAG: APC family permease [archaeon]|nr:APC family permease [archaeon]